MHERACFVTLTYDQAHLPGDLSLDVSHWQLFAKRARKRFGSFRFYHCGEYGELRGRPHYHALLFGIDFRHDRVFRGRNAEGDPLYDSPSLTECWGMGVENPIGEVTPQSARYCASYVNKKLRGPKALEEYGERKPPYSTMSQGIGRDWIDRYYHDVYRTDGVVQDGVLVPPPRYYDERVAKIDPELVEISQFRRSEKLRTQPKDLTPERLSARERVYLGRYDTRAREPMKDTTQ